MASLKSCSGCLSSGLTGVIGVKILLVFDSPYIQECKLKQFHLTLVYVENLRNLVGWSYKQEKFCYIRDVFLFFFFLSFFFFASHHLFFIWKFYFNFNFLLETELLVDQDLIFWSKQILKRKIWLVNFTSVQVSKFNFFKL